MATGSPPQGLNIELKKEFVCLWDFIFNLYVFTPFFPLFLLERSSLPSKLGKPLWSTTTCMYKLVLGRSSIIIDAYSVASFIMI